MCCNRVRTDAGTPIYEPQLMRSLQSEQNWILVHHSVSKQIGVMNSHVQYFCKNRKPMLGFDQSVVTRVWRQKIGHPR